MSFFELKTALSDDLARVINLRKSMEREVLDHLRIDFPVHSQVYVDYTRGGQVYTINATVTGHDVLHGAAQVIVRNNDTGKRRAFDVRCYRIRSQWSGGNSPDEQRVTPQPAPHKRPPAAHQPAKEQSK